LILYRINNKNITRLTNIYRGNYRERNKLFSSLSNRPLRSSFALIFHSSKCLGKKQTSLKTLMSERSRGVYDILTLYCCYSCPRSSIPVHLPESIGYHANRLNREKYRCWRSDSRGRLVTMLLCDIILKPEVVPL
jgi:hypothetical protein